MLWSLAYWGVWVFGLFLLPEVLGWERLAPWVTLSETVGYVEHGRKLLADVVLGFVIGVGVHWRWGTPFGRTELVALALGLVLYLMRLL